MCSREIERDCVEGGWVDVGVGGWEGGSVGRSCMCGNRNWDL